LVLAVTPQESDWIIELKSYLQHVTLPDRDDMAESLVRRAK